MPGSYGRVKQRLFEIIEAAHGGDRASRVFDLSIIVLISLNIIAVVLGSVRSVDLAVGRLLHWFEVFSVTVFTIEYLLRLWTSDLKTEHHDPVAGRLRYMITPMALIDLAAILPFYLPWIVGVDLRFLRAVRLIRLMMLFKVNRYSNSLRLLGDVFHEKRGEIGVTSLIVLIMIIMSSGLMYYIENSAQPDKYGNIPEAILWSIATITSADPAGVFPVTAAGRVLGALTALLGIGLFALPAGILASGFDDVLRRRRLRTAMDAGGRTCPHCGRPLEPESGRKAERSGGSPAAGR